MKVGIPQEKSDQKVGLACASIAEAVVDGRYLTIGMLEIAKVVDTWVTNEDRNDPPEKKGGTTLCGLAKGCKHNDPNQKLKACSLLQILHDSTLLSIREVLHAPSSTAVVYRDAFGRVEHTKETALDSGPNIPKLFKVRPTILRDVAKAWICQKLA